MATAAAAASIGVISAESAAAISAAAPSMAAISAIGTLASAGIGGMGAIQQSRAAAASAGYNAKVAAQNAQIQTQNAQFAGAQGEQNVAAAGAKTKAAIGATLANEGASGVDINSGSNVDVRESEAKIGMLNALNIRSEAARTAYGYQTGAASYTGQAALDRSQQISAQTGGYLTAGADVLSGAGKAGMYMNPNPNVTPQAAKYYSDTSTTGGLNQIY